MVQAVVDLKGLRVNVTASWWHLFQKCHPGLTLCEPETFTHSRINGASVPILEIYFDLLELTFKKGKIRDKPCQIYNLDESGFPRPPKVICKQAV